jgi:hypothetical protein
MKTIVGFAALGAFMLSALTLLPKSAAAQEYPWCAVQYDSDGGEITSCGYVSRQQCMDTVGGGVGGYCRPNPYLAVRPVEPAPAKRRR